MADHTSIRHGRNILTSALHIIMNILLGIATVALTVISGSMTLSLVLLIASKWRIFAVRPRFWFLNIKSSLVDFIVGISVIIIAYCSGTTVIPIHYILSIFYIIWLLFIKPKSTKGATEIQALAAIFLGSTATTLLTANLNAVFTIVPIFIIGYGASRHVLIQSEDTDISMSTLICGLICAEIAWICHSWLIVYTIDNLGAIIPQMSIILTIFAFIFGKAHNSIIEHDGKFVFKDIAIPLVFSVAVVAMIVICFSQPYFEV